MKELKHKWKALLVLCKLFLSWLALHLFHRSLLREDLWLFQEKHTEARDNGYHLYVYMKEHHPEIKSYYSIVKGSPDEKKIRQYGPTIAAESLKHYMYWMAAKCSVNSQPHGAAPAPTYFTYRYRRLCRKDQQVIYLKHGVDKDELSHDLLDYANTRFSLYSCVSDIECDYIRRTFGYPAQVAQVLGFCRYDNLMNAGKPLRQILVMPTFRKWLMSENLEREATEKENARFRESDYYRNFHALLTDKRLLAALGENGYRMVFYPHYSLQSYIKAFADCASDAVIIADRERFDVQQLMLESAAMVTDFSSVFFDFAFMKRPEVFFQFDEAQFRKEHYHTGYFDYRRDAFGPVYTQTGEVVDSLLALMAADCAMQPEYADRVDRFFAFRDSRNCERTYLAIRDLMELSSPAKDA